MNNREDSKTGGKSTFHSSKCGGVRERRDCGEIQSSESNRSNSSRENEEWSTRIVTGPDSGDSDSLPQPRHRVEPWSRSQPNRILLVHGLERVPVNCDRVFNLFCLYGNVTTVKILKDDKVLVELEDIEAAKRCRSNLHLLPLDDINKMKVKYSKHSFIYDQVMFNKLPDGTPAQKVYLASKLNRFPSNGVCLDRRRVAVPSKILHFFNAPIDVCGLAIHKTMSDALHRTDAIVSITILPKKPGAKCSTGLIEMKTIALAVKSVLLSNHMTFESTRSRFPFLTKLCFSKWSEIQQTPADSATLRFSCAPRMPWLLHKSEHAVPMTEFPILRSTVVTDGGGDSPWTLWAMKDETIVTDTVYDDESVGSEQAEQWQWRRQREQLPDGIDKFLLDMLRNRLCGNKDDQGDVLQSSVRSDENNVINAIAIVNQGGPLGDAVDHSIPVGPLGDA